MKKKCTKCGLKKPLKEFNKDKTREDGLYPQCKSCRKQYYVDNPEKQKTRDLKSNYGLSLADFDSMLKEQNYCCAICEQQFDTTKPYVDHCHSTGKIRNLLCQSCNTMLGQAKDDPQVLLAGIQYLTRHSEK